MGKGYLAMGHLRGVPLMIHWTVPVLVVAAGMLVSSAAWSSWAALGHVLLLVSHIGGHWIAARLRQQRIVELHVHGLGGSVLTTGRLERGQRAQLAFGGVLGQGVLWMAATLVQLGGPASVVDNPLLLVLTMGNALLIFANLLPYGPMDGRRGWPLILGRPDGGRAEESRTGDPLAEPGLERRVERVARMLRPTPPPVPRAPPELNADAPPDELPPDIVEAADRLVADLFAKPPKPPDR